MPNLYEQLVARARARADADYIVQAETGQTLTFAETLAGVHALHRLLGPTPRRIALILPNGITTALLWLATLTGGHTLIPVAPDAPPDERRRLSHRFHADLLVLQGVQDTPESGHSPGDTRPHVLTPADCERAITQAIALHPREHDEATPAPSAGYVCLTTSGSTGDPKGVILTADQIAWSAHQIAQVHELRPDDRGLTVLPFHHVNAPVVSLCASLAAGSTVVIAERFSRSDFWPSVERCRVTWASIVPTVLAMLLQTEKPAFLPGALRFVRTASAPLPVVHLRAFERRFGIPVVETYGLSEAAATVAANAAPPGVRKPGSVGRPVGVSMRICRPQTSGEASCHAHPTFGLDDVAAGESGEICVNGPSVIAAYDEGRDPEAFVDGWFRTGDLGYLDEDGYLYVTGRLRETINRGGENIAPREVEEVLLTAPNVGDAAVVGVPDPIYGQRVAAYVVPFGPWSATSPQVLRDHCAAHLSPHKVPDTFIAVAALPRTRSGKVQRHRLRAVITPAPDILPDTLGDEAISGS